jgi:dolichol-phosphate mannosyltransferase
VAALPLVLVVPVYHEQDNIERTLAEIDAKVTTSHETIVVYDDETDPTVRVVKRLSPRYPSVRLLKNDLGPGALRAIQAGFLACPPTCAVAVVMADLADDLVAIDGMYALVASGEWDIVGGSRYMPGGDRIGGSWLKGSLSRFAGLSLHAFAGLPTRDATNSFRMYRSSLLHEIPIESRGGFELALELTVKAFLRGYRVTEVPSTWKERTEGSSRFRLVAWLPSYLRWYWLAMRHGRLHARRASAATCTPKP